jgi:hypothetical protein
MADAAERLVAFLQFGGAAVPVWLLIVGLAALYLAWLGLTTFIARERAERFLRALASTPRANALEASLRFAAGIGFVGASPHAAYPAAFVAAGAVLAVTAVPMLLLPGLHARYAKWVAPLVGPMMPVIGATSLLLAALIGYALLA